MNKAILIGAIIGAVVIGIIVAIIGTNTLTQQQEREREEIQQQEREEIQQQKRLSGRIEIDGSSTVYPITEYIAEKFQNNNPDITISVGISGTGGGYKRFVVGETDINDASRPIKQSEIDSAKQNNVRWVEIPIALEGLSIVVNPSNNWIGDCISIEELKEMWKPDSNINNWNDINPSYPSNKILLYGAGPDSGTFDYFTERVVGESRSSRVDYIPSEDDNVLVQGVASDKYALGYIPLAYVEEAGSKLKTLKISETKGGECIFPDTDAVISGKYPLSRPLFINVNYDKLEREELKAFVEYYIANAKNAASAVKYIPLSDDYYKEALTVFKEGRYNPNDTIFNDLYKKYRGM
ncbi:MAG: PstS family phosphate ABC transporter substrate-binding protein [Candidatus Nitrosocaldaceae archaeon]